MSAVISKATIVFLFVIHLVISAIFIFLMKYPGQEISAPANTNKSNVFGKPAQLSSVESPSDTYSMFQHVHVMVFIGFGFLMTYLKKYGRSSLGFTFFLSCFVIMWYLVLDGLFNMYGTHIYLNIESLVKADQAAATFLISFGAVLGKLNILQLYLMAFIETIIYAANKYLNDEVLLASDAGGSVIVHEFGAFFGLGVSLILGLKDGPKKDKTDLEKSSYQSDISAMIGTLFLWVFWPSFNGILISEKEKFRAVMNTYIALASSCTIVAMFTIISSKNKGWKLDMVYIQNATLAAGVAVGSSANLKVGPWEATFFGSVGGYLSVIGYRYIQGFITKKLRIHDTCGVLSLHGLPGFIGGVAGAIMVYLATEKEYGSELYTIYPGMLPSGEARSRDIQAGFQICSIFCGVAIGFSGGLITGALIILTVPNLTEEERFIDETHWEGYENE